MAPRCSCGHSKTDHLTGRCVNRRMRFDPAVGGTVATQCPCKRFDEGVEQAAPPPVEAPILEEAAEPEPEAPPELESESLEVEVEPESEPELTPAPVAGAQQRGPRRRRRGQ